MPGCFGIRTCRHVRTVAPFWRPSRPMKRERSRWLVVLACAALAVELLELAGSWTWQATVRSIRADVNVGCRRLVDDHWLAWPAAVHWSLRLAPRDLASGETPLVVAALRAVGERQCKWLIADPKGYKNMALAALIDGDVDAAKSDLDAAIRRDPTAPFLRRLLAMVLRDRGDLPGFLEQLAVGEAVAPGFRQPEIELTPEDAHYVRIEGLRRRVELYPSARVSGLIALASELRQVGENDEAMKVMSTLAGHPEAELKLATWALDDEDYPQARARAEAVASNRRLPRGLRGQAWSVVAQARDLEGDSEGALTAAREAMRLDPTSPAPYLALARIAQRQGAYDKALEHLRRAWGIAPADVRVLLAVARAAERANQPADARLALERAVELDPESSHTAALLVEHLLRNGEYMDAALALSRFLDRFPTDRRLLELAGRLRRDVAH
jgi:tetratricopeptide (TPR) repeat protein